MMPPGPELLAAHARCIGIGGSGSVAAMGCPERLNKILIDSLGPISPPLIPNRGSGFLPGKNPGTKTGLARHT
jgi:hypothetical protein